MTKPLNKSSGSHRNAGRPWFFDELDDLSGLAEKLRHSFPSSTPYLRPWHRRCADLHDAFLASDLEAEVKLDALATSLRQVCLQMANLYAARVYRSPPDDDLPRTTEEHSLDFGYERDIQPAELERRIASDMQPIAGWIACHMLFSSGQAALQSVLMAVCHQFWQGRPPAVLHLGSYFETDELLELQEAVGMLEVRERDEGVDLPPDILLYEPVQCTPDGQQDAANDVASFRSLCGQSGVKAVICDTTLCGHRFDHRALLKSIGGMQRPPVVIAFRSGLKLDQAGLELANVGIVSIFVRGGSGSDILREFSGQLQHIRTLTGSGLGFEGINALSVPWFLDPEGRRHADAVFRNNSDLANAYNQASPLLLSHPALQQSHHVAPFCTIQIVDGDAAAYERLEDLIDREAREQGILLRRGGSFGFRGHRYQAIIPDRGDPFLRLALGSRRDASCRKIGSLFDAIATSHFSR